MRRDSVRSRTAYSCCRQRQDLGHCKSFKFGPRFPSAFSVAYSANLKHPAYPLFVEYLCGWHLIHQVLYPATLPPDFHQPNLSQIPHHHGSGCHGLGACGLFWRYIYVLPRRIPVGYINTGHLHRLWQSYTWDRHRQRHDRLHSSLPPPTHTLETSDVDPAKGFIILYSWGRQLVSLPLHNQLVQAYYLHASKLTLRRACIASIVRLKYAKETLSTYDKTCMIHLQTAVCHHRYQACLTWKQGIV